MTLLFHLAAVVVSWVIIWIMYRKSALNQVSKFMLLFSTLLHVNVWTSYILCCEVIREICVYNAELSDNEETAESARSHCKL